MIGIGIVGIGFMGMIRTSLSEDSNAIAAHEKPRTMRPGHLVGQSMIVIFLSEEIWMSAVFFMSWPNFNSPSGKSGGTAYMASSNL